MRRTLLILSVIGLLTMSCERANTSKKSEWMISISVNGVEHKAEGTRDNSYSSLMDYNNIAYTSSAASLYGFSTFHFSMMDKSNESYVKGDNFQFGLTKSGGLDEGDNEFLFSFTGIGVLTGADNIFIPGGTFLSSDDTITINITDLGTPTLVGDPTDVENYYDFGKPVRGNGSADLNFSCRLDDELIDTVLNVTIDFIAVRYP